MRIAFLLALGLSTVVSGQETGKKPAPSAAPPPVAVATTVDPALKARVDLWWKGREVKDHRVMYDLMDPEYRAACSYEAFVTQNVIRTRFDIASHEIVLASRDKERAAVHVSYVTKTMQFGDQTMGAEETWMRDVKGEWWKYWEPVATPFPTPPPAPGTPRNLPCKAP